MNRQSKIDYLFLDIFATFLEASANFWILLLKRLLQIEISCPRRVFPSIYRFFPLFAGACIESFWPSGGPSGGRAHFSPRPGRCQRTASSWFSYRPKVSKTTRINFQFVNSSISKIKECEFYDLFSVNVMEKQCWKVGPNLCQNLWAKLKGFWCHSTTIRTRRGY